MRACYWNLDSGPLWDPWTRELAKWEGSFWRDGGGLSSKWVNMIHLRKHRALSEPKRQFYFKWAMTLWGLSRTRHWCDRLFNIILQSDQWSLLLPTRLVNWFSRFKHIYGDVSNWGASKSSFKVGNPIPANFQLGCCLKSRSTWITSQKKTLRFEFILYTTYWDESIQLILGKLYVYKYKYKYRIELWAPKPIYTTAV